MSLLEIVDSHTIIPFNISFSNESEQEYSLFLLYNINIKDRRIVRVENRDSGLPNKKGSGGADPPMARGD